MKLTFDQCRDLRDVLISAFPNQSDLDLMVEDELKIYLNQITHEQPNYKLVVRALIIWANSRGKSALLLKGALRSNPGNQELQNFVKKYQQTSLKNDLSLDLSSLISQEIADLEVQIQQTVGQLRQQRSEIFKRIINVIDIQWLDELRRKYREALSEISLNLSTWMNAERTTIYFLNDDKDQLWSIFAQGGEDSRPIEINLRVGFGISGRVAKYGKTENISYPARECEHAKEILKQDERNNFKTYTLLTIPIKNERQQVFAVIQFINRLRQENEAPIDVHESNYEEYGREGFTTEDERKFLNLISQSTIRHMLEGLQDYYNLAQQFKGGIKSTQAAQILSQNSEDFSEALQRIMVAAKELMNADRSTLWILDHSGERLWTQIPSKDGRLQQKSIVIGKGFAGSVAKLNEETGQYPVLNIPFDAYDHHLSEIARESDRDNNYRTYSVLCMPVIVYDESVPEVHRLIGVTQLLNKVHEGFSSQTPNINGVYECAPACFETNFTKDDERRMRAFNAQVALVLQSSQCKDIIESRATLFALFTNAADFVTRLLQSESVVVYLFDEQEQKLWSIIENSQDSQKVFKVLEHPRGKRLIRQFVDSGESLFVNRRPESAKSLYDRSKLIFPLFDDKNKENEEKLLAVIEVSHKYLSKYGRKLPIDENDYQGFTHEEKATYLDPHLKTLLNLVQSCQAFHKTLKVQESASKLVKAQQAVFGVVRENYMEKVMESARELVNADRCTLWRLDSDSKVLVAEGYIDQNGLKVLSINPLLIDTDKGYAAQAARKALRENQSSNISSLWLKVDCDLYVRDEERSQTAKQTDRQIRYRTCSLLCMPIFDKDDKLLGILQLVNKLRSNASTLNDYSSYLDTAEVPPCFDASFNEQDIRQLEQFNHLVGSLIYEEIAFEAVRRKTVELR